MRMRSGRLCAPLKEACSYRSLDMCQDLSLEAGSVHHLSLFISAASIVVSILVSRFLTLRIIGRLNRRAGQTTHFLATPVGSTILFALVFVVVWCVVSFLLAIPWLLLQSQTS